MNIGDPKCTQYSPKTCIYRLSLLDVCPLNFIPFCWSFCGLINHNKILISNAFFLPGTMHAGIGKTNNVNDE